MLPEQAKTLSEITGGVYYQQKPFPESPVSKIFTDSRKIYGDEHALFVALKGPNYDGHAFIKTAYDKGIRLFLVEQFQEDLPNDARQLKVANTLHALHQWAVQVRKQFFGKVIAVTGSNGKTMFKEWLSTLLEDEIPVYKNPKSYNSQLGVPLSLIPLNNQSAVAILEAGISTVGEMEKLARLIKPKIGVFTHLGSAHDEGFSSREEKLSEKLKLFKEAQELILPERLYRDYQEQISSELPNVKLYTVGSGMEADYRVLVQRQEQATQIVWQHPKEAIFQIPFTDESSINNLLLVIATYMHLGLSTQKLQQYLQHLRPIPMRLQYSLTHGNSLIINDSYSLDIESLSVALDFLDKQAGEREKVLILSPFPGQENTEDPRFHYLLEQIAARNISKVFFLSKELDAAQQHSQIQVLQGIDAFLDILPSLELSNKAILVKGARSYTLEKVVQALQSHRHQTTLEINLSAIQRNYEAMRAHLQPNTKIMSMVKAAAYGGGQIEVANILQKQGTDYIGVAFTKEGIDLRKAGISCPILVLNPWMDEAEQLLQYNLSPALYRRESLLHFEEAARAAKKDISVHIKLETGMHRLGFKQAELPDLLELLQELRYVKVAGLYSHLAAADDADYDSFTQAQISQFKQMAQQLEPACDKKTLRHICNTAGALRFPEGQFDMVRLGIGLYGYNPGKFGPSLELAMQFKSSISQIKTLEQGQSVGYARSYIAEKNTRIGIVPVGYADGLPRSSGNGRFSVLLPDHGLAPIIGNVCMDMCMIDLSSYEVSEGQPVIIFNNQHPIENLASANNTIPYEILSRISQRVKRIYYED